MAELPGFDLVHRLTFGLGREDFARAWTPDSQAVVFDSNRNGTWELFRQKLNSPMDEPLVHSADDAFSPRLSPDGRWFLYMDRPKSWGLSEPVKIVRVPVAGGPAQEVLEAAGISDWGLRFACSAIAGGPCVLAQRQGKQIAFRKFDVLRGLEAGEALRVDADGAHPVAWSISPDGSKLALARWDAVRGRIEVAPLGAGRGSATEVVSGCSHIHSLRWATDGKGWFVTSEWPVSWRISYVADNGSARVLARGTGMHAPDVVPSPDGRRVAFSQRITESNLWLLDGF